MLTKIITKLFEKMIKPIQGKLNWQTFFETLYRLSLTGMNIGEGADSENSGEVFVLKYIREKNKKMNDLTIFDVGANVGKYTLLINKVFGEKKLKIFSFEPSKKSFEKLTANIKGVHKLKIFNLGFGEKKGTATLFSDKNGSSLSSLYKRKLDHFNLQVNIKETVNIETVDDFCLKNNITHINFLKLDTEGNELQILKGADKMINSGKIDFIQFEFGGCNIDSKTYFQDFYYLLNQRYQIYRVLKNGLLPIKKYRETNEIFLTTNYLAEKK